MGMRLPLIAIMAQTMCRWYRERSSSVCAATDISGPAHRPAGSIQHSDRAYPCEPENEPGFPSPFELRSTLPFLTSRRGSARVVVSPIAPYQRCERKHPCRSARPPGGYTRPMTCARPDFMRRAPDEQGQRRANRRAWAEGWEEKCRATCVAPTSAHRARWPPCSPRSPPHFPAENNCCLFSRHRLALRAAHSLYRRGKLRNR